MYFSKSLWVPLPYSVSRRQQNLKREQNCKAWGNFCQQNECQRVYWRVSTTQRMCKNKQQRRQKRVYSLTSADTETKWLFTRENDGNLDLVYLPMCESCIHMKAQTCKWGNNANTRLVTAANYPVLTQLVHTNFLLYFYWTLSKTIQKKKKKNSLFFHSFILYICFTGSLKRCILISHASSW